MPCKNARKLLLFMHEERLSKYIKNSYTIKRTGNLRSLFFEMKTLRSHALWTEPARHPSRGLFLSSVMGLQKEQSESLVGTFGLSLSCLCLSNRDRLWSSIQKSQIFLAVMSLALFISLMTKIRVVKWSLKNIVVYSVSS